MEFYVAKDVFKAYLMTWKNAHGMLSGKSRIYDYEQYDSNCVSWNVCALKEREKQSKIKEKRLEGNTKMSIPVFSDLNVLVFKIF